MMLFNGDTLLAESDEIIWIESEQGYKVDSEIFVDTQRAFTVVDTEKQKRDVQQSLDDFAREKDFDGIGEASALVNCPDPQWSAEAKKYVELWYKTWKAFELNEPLPVLTWD
jgi:hypothetical protein